MLERNVDRNIVAWAKEQWPDMIIRKLSTLGSRGRSGDPDRLFLWGGKMLLIEMKAPKQRCTDLQLEVHNRWRKAGAVVVVISDVSAGRMVLNQYFGGKKRTSLRSIA